MRYDTVIIGGGLAGLVCGIRCAGTGMRTLILSAGMNTLHFSSGSFQVMSYDKTGEAVTDPLKAIEEIQKTEPDHPYSRVPMKTIKESLGFLQSVLAQEGIKTNCNHFTNTLLPTCIGKLKPACLYQRLQYPETVPAPGGRIAVINIEGYRDFHEDVFTAGLSQQKEWRKCGITHGTIPLPVDSPKSRSAFELRSHDISQILDRPSTQSGFARALAEKTGNADLIIMPAVFGLALTSDTHEVLERKTGKQIIEIPTIPPSIPGMRIDRALRSAFMASGGEYSPGERVTGGLVKNGRLVHIQTELAPGEEIEAENFVLATGSFISDGLAASRDSIYEPVFDLKVDRKKREDLARFYFFSQEGHGFINTGVETDGSLRAVRSSGETVSNLYCAGSILAHYDPVLEGSGGGVCIATGYRIAETILGKEQ